MNTITLPKEITKREDLIVIPRKKYEEFLGSRKTTDFFEPPRNFKTYKPTAAEKKEIAAARRDFEEGRYLEWHQFKHELDNFYRGKGAKRSQAPASKGRNAHKANY